MSGCSCVYDLGVQCNMCWNGYHICMSHHAFIVVVIVLAACKPGYFSRVATPQVCEICPKDFFCKGGVGGAATKTSCSDNNCLGTVTTGAQNSSACITKAGCGFNLDSNSALGFTGTPCTIGKYSAGANKQGCTACPPGLTTAQTRTTTIDGCMAPPGYYYKVGTLSMLHIIKLSTDAFAGGSTPHR